jgi:hypothetical protein
LHDEISMTKRVLFDYINLRLQDVKGDRSRPFGGVHYLAFENLFQISPCFDKYVFEDLKTEYKPLAQNIWKDHFTLYELQTIMQQRDAAVFANRLNRLREGKHTADDIEALKKRLLAVACDKSKYSILYRYMFSSHKKINVHNGKALEELSAETIHILAVDRLTAANVPVALSRQLLVRASELDFWKTQGLLYCLEVKLSMIVDMTCNPDTPDGLCNGAWGPLQTVDFGIDNESRIVNVLWIKFNDERVGQKRRLSHAAVYQGRPDLDRLWTPVYRLSKTFTIDRRTHLTKVQRS